MLTIGQTAEAVGALTALPGGSRQVRQTVLSTLSEMWCEAELYTIPLNEVAGPLEAFLCLWARHVAWVEELDLDRTPESVLRHMTRALQADTDWGPAPLFTPLTEADWNHELGIVVGGIVGELAEVRSGLKRSAGKPVELVDGPLKRDDPRTYWGVFADGERMDERDLNPGLAPGSFVDGLAIRRRWNDVQLFARTTEVFALFVWGTGA